MRIHQTSAAAGVLLICCLVLSPGCSRKRDPEKYLRNANRFYDARAYEKAKVEYINALRQQPTNATAILRLGKIFYRQGQLLQAAPFLLEGRRHFPADIESAQHLATIWLAAGDLEKARLAARAVLELDPTQEVALTVLADSSRTPKDAQELISVMDQLQRKSGDRAIFHVIRAQLAQRGRDLATTESELQKAIALDDKSPSAHLALAMFRWGQGATNRAEQSFRNAAQVAAPEDPARFRLATFLFRTDRIAEAKQLLEEVTRATPERSAAWNLRAEIALREKNFEECGRLLDRVLGQTPNDLEARMLQAKLRLEQKKPDQAIRLLESMAQTSRSAEIQYQLGIAHLKNNDTRQAASSLTKAVSLDTNNVSAAMLLAEVNISRGQSATAVTMLTDLVRRAPNFAPAQFLLGRAYVRSYQWENALALYQNMRTAFPKDPNVPYQLGVILRLRNRVTEAQKAFAKSRELAPNNPAPLEQLVDIALTANNPAQALALLQPELDRQPQMAVLWMLRARVYIAENNSAGAEAALERAIDLQSENQAAYLMLADLYQKAGQPKESLKKLSSVIEKDPTNIRALMLSGMINAEIGNIEDAERIYGSLLKREPNNVLALNNLAYLLAEHRNRLDQAYVNAAKARGLAPTNSVVADTMGWIEFRRGNYSEALRLLSDAHAGLGGRPEVEAHFGLAQYMAGRETEARSALDAALKTAEAYPTRGLAEQRRATLTALATTGEAQLIPVLEKRRKEDPQDLIALLRLGAAFEAAGNLDGAREAYEAALKLNPAALPVLNRLIASEIDRNPTRANELARQAQLLDPDDPNVTQVLGRLALKSDDAVTAFGLLQSSARQLTNQPQAWLYLADAAFGAGRIAETREALLTVLRLGGPPAITNAARTSLEMLNLARNPQGAAQGTPQIQQALAANPNLGSAQFASAIALEGQGKYAEARDTLEKLVQRFPSCTPAIRQLAILYDERLNNDAKAYEFAAKARVALPSDDILAKTLGRLSYRRGDFRYAVQLFSEVARNRPQDADVQFQLGLAYLRLKQLPESRAALEKAITLDPKGAFVPEAKKLLAENKPG